ncbi:mitochondrial basic amino acids transporter-like [Saccoglossus kowalevskii]
MESETEMSFGAEATNLATRAPTKIKYEVLLDFVGGCFGGIAGVVVGHPFDTVKVRLQTQNVQNNSVVSRLVTSPSPSSPSGLQRFPVHTVKPEVVAPHAYRSTWHCFASTVKEEGFFGLYKGLASPLAGLAFINAIIFGVQANTLRQFKDQTIVSHSIAGAAAGAVQCVVACPMELAKVRLQLQGKGESHHYYSTHKHAYKGSIQCIYKIYIKEGIKGCYRGLNSTLIRDIPGFTLYFAAYETFCTFFQSRHPKGENLGLAELIIAGGLSGTCSWLLSHPIDVIKSRIQADAVEGTPLYRGTIDCLRKSIKAEGFRVFLNGLSANLLRSFPVNAATFTVYTYFMRYCNNHFNQT